MIGTSMVERFTIEVGELLILLNKDFFLFIKHNLTFQPIHYTIMIKDKAILYLLA